MNPRFLRERFQIEVIEYDRHDQVPHWIGVLHQGISRRSSRALMWGFRTTVRPTTSDAGTVLPDLHIIGSALPQPLSTECLLISAGIDLKEQPLFSASGMMVLQKHSPGFSVETTARHSSAEFVDFLGQIVASQPEGREIHIVADNLSAHKTKKVFEFLQANPTLRIHFTPTYSSWLNQVEIWFSKIQRDVISRGIFTSTTDLSRKLIRYIKQYNKTATPFRWRFQNADNRIKPATQRASDSMH
jgi:transposase